MYKFLLLFCFAILIFTVCSVDILKVSGNSMEPQFEDGCYVIAGRNLFHLHKPAVGDVVIFTNPLTGKHNIKRCTAVDKTSVFVTGFNMPESTDSRHFGRISISDIEGWVWKKI